MSSLNELQKTELDILKEFSRIAKREKLTWYVMFGTLLGAVRQKGFIPWDDDIDIAMPRNDYDRLRLSSGWFAEPYYLQTPHNDPAAAPRFIRLRRSDTAVLAGFPNGLTRSGNMGAYIDILPLDEVPGIDQARKLHSAAMRIQKQMLACAALDESTGSELPDWKVEFCYGFGGIAESYSLVATHYEQVLSRYSGAPYYSIPVLIGSRGCRIYEKNWFSDQELMVFEGMQVPAASGWREILVASYPDGLLEPEVNERKSKYGTEDAIVDMERPYKDYLQCYAGMLDGISDKRVCIFGAGDSLRIWMERYSENLDIICAFDNSKTKWGTNAYNIPVRPPDELPSIINGNSRLIIASIHHREIIAQLNKMGIEDYYVFVDGWNYGKGVR